MHAFLNGPANASNQQCSKIGYPSRREAMRIMKKHGRASPQVSSGKGKLGCFKCKICKLYHLGHE